MRKTTRLVVIAFLGACSNGAHDAQTEPTNEGSDTEAADTGEHSADVTDSATDPDTEAPVPMANGEHTLEHNGLTRTYLLHQPQDLTTGAPLVLVLHGYTGSATQIQDYSGFNAVADANGFVVAYPQGTADEDGEPFFNVGYDFHEGVTTDDVGFIKAVVSTLETNLGINSEHVFATGLSNGGEFSYMLACEAADVFRAVASVAGVMFESFAENCSPSREISVLEIHGTDDTVNWYGGDPTSEGGWGPYRSIEAGMDFWRTFNALDEDEIISIPDSNESDGSYVEKERYWSLNTATEVWLYRVVGGDHDWPGSWGNMDIDASEVVWEFFERSMAE